MKESPLVSLSRYFLAFAVAAVAAALSASTASALPPAVGAPPTFAAATPLPGSPSPSFVVASGDFDGDLHQDVATGTSGGVVEWLADGAHPISLGGDPFRAVSADFDRDGRDDLAVTDGSGKVAVLRGGPNGLTPAGSTTVGGQPFDISAGDADADGDTDLVVVDLPSAGAPVTLLTNDGTGAFTKTPLDSGCASGAISAVIGQFVGDPRADVAVLCQTAQLRFLAPNTAGVFVPSGTQPTCGGVNGGDLDVGDFDEDGHDDLVAVCSQSRFSVHLAADSFVSRTGPTGDAWFNLNRGGSGIPLRVVATDLNGDGHIDVVTNSYTAAERSAGVATGDGAVGDVDDDGRPDLIAAAGAVGVAHNTTPTPSREHRRSAAGRLRRHRRCRGEPERHRHHLRDRVRRVGALRPEHAFAPDGRHADRHGQPARQRRAGGSRAADDLPLPGRRDQRPRHHLRS